MEKFSAMKILTEVSRENRTVIGGLTFELAFEGSQAILATRDGEFSRKRDEALWIKKNTQFAVVKAIYGTSFGRIIPLRTSIGLPIGCPTWGKDGVLSFAVFPRRLPILLAVERAIAWTRLESAAMRRSKQDFRCQMKIWCQGGLRSLLEAMGSGSDYFHGTFPAPEIPEWGEDLFTPQERSSLIWSAEV